MRRLLWLSVFLLPLSVSKANDVSIVDVVFQKTGDNTWRVDTTLAHADTGWEHYADGWRIVDSDGTELAMRVLYHPHIEEQPFKRSVTATIPADLSVVIVEAHDKKHGWSKDRVTVDLRTAHGARYEVRQ